MQKKLSLRRIYSVFKKFLQSALNARREGDENPNSNVVTETMKLLANSSYGYQNMDRSPHTVIKYLSDEKTQVAINTKMFKYLDHINDQLYETKFGKSRYGAQRTNHCWVLHTPIR